MRQICLVFIVDQIDLCVPCRVSVLVSCECQMFFSLTPCH